MLARFLAPMVASALVVGFALGVVGICFLDLEAFFYLEKRIGRWAAVAVVAFVNVWAVFAIVQAIAAPRKKRSTLK